MIIISAVKNKEIRKPKQVRTNNCKAILSMFRMQEVLQIGDIVKEVKLSKTTVSKIILSLVNKGLILSYGKGDSTEEGGKKPELFSLNAEYGYCLTVGIEDERIRCCLYDLGLKLVESAEKAIKKDQTLDYEEAINISVTLCEALLSKKKIGKEKVFAVSCYDAGIIDGENGIISFPIKCPHWGRNLKFKEDFIKRYGYQIPVYVENGTRFSGYAEMLHLKENNYSSCAVIYSSPKEPGVGGCIIRNQAIIHGSNNFLGEFGHMVVNPNSRIKCACGNYGCMENEVSGQALLRYAHEKCKEYPKSLLADNIKNQNLKVENIHEAANEGDEFARSLLDRIVYYYSICIWNIIVTNDPETVILQGLPVNDNSYFISALRKKMYEVPFFGVAQKTSVQLSQLNYPLDELMHKGAALYVCNEFLNDSSNYE